ncbi:toll/interleukin-1 receptor domain-containing protein [Providencia alcalifaciens]|uniref:toll/interleukin-1 receptor domain-containing protein n=1 Tax=Providencia alcalifaciens TaxID=126385 RepID=UPI00044C1406|nr:toll/interleukin-1 receptor domain-containing protein [Providencia alcalifaciens]ETT08373.1 SEFIR domain protein [Providencia alcalifaciens F90-2004]EUC97025.1 SEFIR domain protein [Providencia alcalifaciens PAL-2]MTB30972.1 TIR domain-containing protein [Providencia alcalifaciens]MTC98835.1 TIR domain-containing protein [Providencia alcalifaciens]
MSIPKAFISYSHDSQEHKKWVLDLATRLRNNGVDAILDQWDLQPGDDLPSFMEKGLSSSDRVLMICTDKYVQKANSGAGGVGYEKMIVTADLLKTIDSNKVIPIIHQNGSHDVPNFLRTKMFLDFSRQDQYEFSFDELIRTLHNSPLYEKPPVANNPFVPVSETPPNRTGDGVLTVMSIIAALFESEYGRRINYKKLVLRASMSRIILDLYIDEAKSLELIELDPLGDIILTTKGKHYIIKHKLINDQMNSINT